MPRFSFAPGDGTLQPAGGVAAGAVYTPLQAASWQYEYLPWNAVIRLLDTCTAAGVLRTIFSGSETIQQETPVDASGTTGKLPNAFTSEPIGFRAPGGDRLQVRYRNTSGAAVPIMGIIDVNPAA